MGFFSSLGKFLVGAAQIVAGGIISLIPGGAALGVPLMIAGALSLGVAALTPSSTPRALGGTIGGGFSSSSTYGFDRLTNAAFEGAPRFFVLGKHNIAPSMISAFTEQNGTTQTLRAIYFCGTGGQNGIESIDNIKLNDQAVQHFPGVKTYTRLGLSTQTVISGFDKVSIPHEVGSTVETDELTYTTHAEVDEIALVWAWAGGLYGIDTSGNVQNETWKATIQWQDTSVGGNVWSTKTVSVTASTRAVHRYVIRLNFRKTVTVTGYDAFGNPTKTIVTGDKVPQADGSYDYISAPTQITFKVKAVTVSTTQATQRATLLRVEEVVHETETYAGSALLAIEAVAQEALSGGLPTVTCDVKGWRVPAINGTTARWSQNPAELLRAVLTDPDDGLGKWITDADLDLTGQWLTTSTYMAGQVSRRAYTGDTAKEDRHHLDIVVDSMQSASDWLSHICSLYRCGIVEWGGKLHLVVDKAQPGGNVRQFVASVTQGTVNGILPKADGTPDFTEQEIEVGDKITHIKAQYWDEGNGYERRWTNELIAPEWTSSIPPVRKELYLPGITRLTEARRQIRYVQNRARLTPTIYEWGVGMQALDLVPFDVVSVYLDSPLLGGVAVLILATTKTMEGTGRIVGMKYDARIYDDNDDTIPPVAPLVSRQDALKRARQIPRGAANVTIKDVIA